MTKGADRPGGNPSPAYPVARWLDPLRSFLGRLPSLSRLPRFDPRAVSLRTVAVVVMVAGAVTCLVPIAIVGYGMWQESQLTQEWARGAHPQTAADAPTHVDPNQILPPFATPAPAPATPAPSAPPAATPSIPALFAIRVPKIGYYAAVRQGVSMDILAVGPGHYPTTALPGKPGLVGVAAHNTFWIPFGNLGPGDTVVLETRSGSFTYRITGTKIVSADDRTVMVNTADPRLVLTTCWPLWAGNLAPQRLAILAQLV